MTKPRRRCVRPPPSVLGCPAPGAPRLAPHRPVPVRVPQVLYSFAGDFRALKAHIAAAYNELTLVRKDAGSQDESAAFASKSPLGKLPVLETEAGGLPAPGVCVLGSVD